MSEAFNKRSEEFLKISAQFKLGVLTTEGSHPVTAKLSDVAKEDIQAALGLLFDVDQDVVRKYRDFVESGRAASIHETVAAAVRSGGKLFFTGCGSTGRLSIQLVSIWRDFWQRQRQEPPTPIGQLGRDSDATTRTESAAPLACSSEELENCAFAVMAGGDFALIKAVEGFEDFTEFGERQLGDLGVSSRDVVFAITEGGETSFVIGTAWKGVEVGAKVYFVYNNPDEVLCRHVQRSREVIEEPRIEKINLTTGPMAITGSTRMQATSIQLAVLATILEMVVRDLMGELEPSVQCRRASSSVPQEFLLGLEQLHATLKLPGTLSGLARLTELEEATYRCGRKTNYYANRFGIDVLTDTTERSPTYCTPPFRKFDDTTASESWAFLFVPEQETSAAWEHILKNRPNCIHWTEAEVRALVGEEKAVRAYETIRKIGYLELMRFRIGLDGLNYRKLNPGDTAIAVVSESEKASLLSATGFHRVQLEAAQKAGAHLAVVYFGSSTSCPALEQFVRQWNPDCVLVLVPLPETALLLDGVTRVAVKVSLNALSTCTMVRLGRVIGNFMIWVVPSNLKLIDRATRYIERLTGLGYRESNQLLFEVIEYIEPRMKADQAYPPVVGVAVTRMRYGVGNEGAEERLIRAPH